METKTKAIIGTVMIAIGVFLIDLIGSAKPYNTVVYTVIGQIIVRQVSYFYLACGIAIAVLFSLGAVLLYSCKSR